MIPARKPNAPIRLVIGRDAPDAAADPVAFHTWLTASGLGRRIECLELDGVHGERRVLRTLALACGFLADTAEVVVTDADYASVHAALVETVAINRTLRLDAIELDAAPGARPGRAIARMSFSPARPVIQNPVTLPAPKNRALAADDFADAESAMPLGTATTLVQRALARWHAPTRAEAEARRDVMAAEFPDGASVQRYWHEETGKSFTGFFAWGHDHDFGHGVVRRGTMGPRHVEIVGESLAMGLLPMDLAGARVLDVGCWTGGDLLALAGLGAEMEAIEEHPASSRAAQRLADLSGLSTTVHRASLYADREEWRGCFDVVYASGVLYHVTDPLLFLRICFAYLKPGGRLVIETKAEGGDGSACAYAGTREKGWNWYSPTRAALGRLLVDAGFDAEDVTLHWRPIGRLLAGAVKRRARALPETAGFSRPASWLAGEV